MRIFPMEDALALAAWFLCILTNSLLYSSYVCMHKITMKHHLCGKLHLSITPPYPQKQAFAGMNGAYEVKLAKSWQSAQTSLTNEVFWGTPEFCSPCWTGCNNRLRGHETGRCLWGRVPKKHGMSELLILRIYPKSRLKSAVYWIFKIW